MSSLLRPTGPTRAIREPAYRLDLLANPYGPSVAVAESLAAGAMSSDAEIEGRLRLGDRLAANLAIPAPWLVLGAGCDDLLRRLLAVRGEAPLVVFPPAAASELGWAGQPAVELRRDPELRAEVDLETAAELPPGAITLVGSPSDPSGAPLAPPSAVRLARACRLLIVDERHLGYGARSLLPLAREFDNVVLLQTFETWAALGAFPLAWAIGRPRTLRTWLADLPSPSAGAVAAALATLDDLRWVLQMVRRVRDERGRLYRMLRKSNVVQPLPSWANFLLARIERGDPAAVVAGLAERGVVVARPPDPSLDRFVRIAAGRPEATDALRRALVGLAAEL